ncbi:putative DNA modification/repair radical SAM protein [Luteolibacter flavescens]|uniref:DNA modification/repair radical SAM protein n=1 Tax=Luteolibacter flavescens TaxID=1859460 RepID=A0ABT3FKS2_9BACT|nr:putative DNA modification/repair radical SAM protein [Luteolibacter flavescens]MCW1884047.1 putative DNA modification/repair radical SAM protein [Luteolibacter flavescens]
MDLDQKLSILADAAKYDASCASSGATKRDSLGGTGVGSTGGAGICHSYAPDGRCISLLKILLTNRCLYDCHYCINRRSSNVRRAAFTAEEAVRLTLDFYKRNYIEGLFLSSGIIRSADHTMEQVVNVARTLREVHDFRGYIHLKTIPEASPELIEQAARYADRISINLELPTQQGLDRLAPEKNLGRTKQAMGRIRVKLDDAADRKRGGDRKLRHATGQSTQVIVGADPSTDADFLARSDELYRAYRLRRVYYSAFSPIPEPSSILPPAAPPLMREHRLYQADWLMRYYGFSTSEILTPENPNLDLHLDPKLAWALRNRHEFPLDLQTASRDQMLRIPGLGVKNVDRLLGIRRLTLLRLADLARLRISLPKVRPFIIVADHHPAREGLDTDRLLARLAPKPVQLDLFGHALR